MGAGNGCKHLAEWAAFETPTTGFGVRCYLCQPVVPDTILYHRLCLQEFCLHVKYRVFASYHPARWQIC